MSDGMFDRPVGLSGPGLRRWQAGVTAIEYALLASLIAMVVIGGIVATGGNLAGLYDYIADRVNCALSSGVC